jgi:hypothetical protein
VVFTGGAGRLRPRTQLVELPVELADAPPVELPDVLPADDVEDDPAVVVPPADDVLPAAPLVDEPFAGEPLDDVEE